MIGSGASASEATAGRKFVLGSLEPQAHGGNYAFQVELISPEQTVYRRLSDLFRIRAQVLAHYRGVDNVLRP